MSKITYKIINVPNNKVGNCKQFDLIRLVDRSGVYQLLNDRDNGWEALHIEYDGEVELTVISKSCEIIDRYNAEVKLSPCSVHILEAPSGCKVTQPIV